MPVILFHAVPLFLAVIFLSATFYYRSKVIRCQERLRRIWVEIMLSNSSPAQKEEGIDLFFDGKDNEFKPLKAAEADTNSIIPLVDSVQSVDSTPIACTYRRK